MNICSALDLPSDEWDALRSLYIHAFVTMSRSVSASDLALMDDNPEKFWAGVFDRDKPLAMAKNYTFLIYTNSERTIAYSLYTYASDIHYLYIQHFVVHPDYQGQGLGKKLMSAMQELHLEAKKIGLLTRTYNLQAQNFYKRLGFSPSSDVPSTIGIFSSDRVYMQRTML